MVRSGLPERGAVAAKRGRAMTIHEKAPAGGEGGKDRTRSVYHSQSGVANG